MKFHDAVSIANGIWKYLRPHCEAIEIAGSIRRQCNECNDIDIVLIPVYRNAIHEWIRNYMNVSTNGDQIVSGTFWPNGCQLDLYFANGTVIDLFDETPSNWGSMLVCRTGSRQHNIKLCQKAARLGLAWKPHEGVYRDGGLIASETEEAVFEALGMKWVEPKDRE